MEVEETKSARGNPLFRVNDFVYEVDKRLESKFFCRCIRKKSENCIARAIIVKDPELMVLKLDREHNHEEERRDRIMRDAKEKMKRAALLRPDKSCREVYNEVLAETVRELQASQDLGELGSAFPSFDGVRSTIERTRRSKVRPTSCGPPVTLAGLTLEGDWSKTSDGEEFLLFNDGSDNRILGFSTHECMKIVLEAPSVYMDGTFGIVPSPFVQLYTIHSFYKGQMMPMIFFLLPDKRKEVYVRMFSLLKNYAQNAGLVFQPKKMLTDFGVAAMEAVEECFPATLVKGCNFHFCQEVWKRAQQLGLTTFCDDSTVRRFLRSAIALSLVPLERLDEAWLGIVREAPGEDHAAHRTVNEFQEYFKNTWIGNESIFPRTLWNNYRNLAWRTADHIEAWHRAFYRVVRKTPVNVFGIITHLKKEEQRLRLQRVLLTMNLPPQAMREKYRTLSERLPRLVDQFESNEISLLEYVGRVVANLPSVTVIM